MMFAKPLKVVKDNIVVLEMKIVIISIKQHMFLENDQLILFNAAGMGDSFSVPKKSEIFINGDLVGISGASGSIDIKSDQFTGILHALYICS